MRMLVRMYNESARVRSLGRAALTRSEGEEEGCEQLQEVRLDSKISVNGPTCEL